jgi:hypothetical protein
LSVDYNVNVLTNRLQQVLNAIDAGAAAGFMRLLDPGGNVLSSIRLFFPCGTVSNGVLTFKVPLIDAGVTTGGLATGARCEDANGVVVFSGLTINTINADINLSPTNVLVAGQILAITAASITGN